VLLLHWLGLLLDELLFRGYRRVDIVAPVFVLGVPRSGTTFLHRTLAADEAQFTTVSTWEVLFAPSVTQRVFWRGLAGLDRLVGRPCGRLLGILEKKLFRGLDGVHDVSLQAAEEDYLLLLPLMSCFILFLPFTESGYIWNLAKLDWEKPVEDRQRILKFYRACIQKHLYFHGKEKRYLAKNAAFASWVRTLQNDFPDGRFVICLRQPDKAVPSLLGSLESGARLFQLDLQNGWLPERLLEMMQDCYRHLIENLKPEWELVLMEDLESGIAGRVERIYQRFGLELSDDYRGRLLEVAENVGAYTTRTRYVDPAGGAADDFFRRRFPWYYELVEGDAMQRVEQG